MKSEKVNEIKKALSCSAGDFYAEPIDCKLCKFSDKGIYSRCKGWELAKDSLTLINELESENERLRKEKEDLRLFDIALGSGKVDMTLGGNTAKSFINAIVQIFEQNNATNFLATTIETMSSGNKYSLVIQKENGQTPSEKLTELKDRIAKLEKEKSKLNIELDKRDCIDYPFQLIEREHLKQFAERLKENDKIKVIFNDGWIFSYVEICKAIDETLKEFEYGQSKPKEN